MAPWTCAASSWSRYSPMARSSRRSSTNVCSGPRKALKRSIDEELSMVAVAWMSPGCRLYRVGLLAARILFATAFAHVQSHLGHARHGTQPPYHRLASHIAGNRYRDRNEGFIAIFVRQGFSIHDVQPHA